MKRNLIQTGIVLGSVALVVLFVLRERLADWLSPPHFEEKAGATVEKVVYRCPMDGFERSDAGPCGICKMPLTDERRVTKRVAAQGDDPWVYVCPMDGYTRSDPGPCAIPS